MKITLLSVLIFLLFCGGCSIFRVKQSEPDSGIGLSGSFNAGDSDQVAREISLEIISQPWLESFREGHKRSPVLMIGTLTNESYQTIDMRHFTSRLMHEILNAGQIPFVEEIQVPLQDLREPSLELARELKADFYLTGAIRSAEASVKGRQTRYLQLDMQLVNPRTGQSVWTTLRPIRQSPSQSHGR